MAYRVLNGFDVATKYDPTRPRRFNRGEEFTDDDPDVVSHLEHLVRSGLVEHVDGPPDPKQVRNQNTSPSMSTEAPTAAKQDDPHGELAKAHKAAMAKKDELKDEAPVTTTAASAIEKQVATGRVTEPPVEPKKAEKKSTSTSTSTTSHSTSKK